MKAYRVCLLLICAASLAACSSTGSVNDGAGYSRLTMQPATRNYIVNNDVPFAQQVVAHNEQCQRDTLCQK